MNFRDLFIIIFLAIAIFFFLFGAFTNKTVGYDEGFPFYIFGFYLLIATVVLYV